MRSAPIHWLFILSVLGDLEPSAAHAQSDETIVIIDDGRGGIDDLVGAEGQAPGANRAMDVPAFVTTIRVDDHELESHQVATVLAETVGVSIRSLGGLGSFSSISVRGAAPGNTAVFIDGVPLSRIASVTTDLGPFQLDNFSELSIIRGGAPVEYGGANTGGALDLKTGVGPDRDGRPLRLSLGAGSFGTRHLSGRWLGGRNDGRRGEHIALSYDGARGNFPFFDDGGTNLDASDDHIERRRNNDYSQLSAVGRIRLADTRRRLTLGFRGAWRDQGIPGSVAQPSDRASLATWTGIADADLEVDAPFGWRATDVGLRAYGLLESQRYRDLEGSVGLAAEDRRYHQVASGLQGHLGVKLASWNRLSGALEAQLDHFREIDLLPSDPSPRTVGARMSGAVSFADDMALGGWRLSPAIRIDTLHTVPLADSAAGVLGPMALDARTETFVSPRVSGRYLVTPALALKANAGRYSRAPTILELFGDRGFIVGNPALRAESGDSADFGVVLAPRRGLASVDRIYVEAAAFAARSQDTIALSSGGLATRAQNIGRSRLLGSEVAASARFARTLSLSGNYTFLDSKQLSGDAQDKQLPQRPAHDFYFRTDVAGRIRDALWVVWADAHLIGQNYTDVNNLRLMPARQFAGAGVKLALASGLRFGGEVKNLGNQRVEQTNLSPPPRPDLQSIPHAISDVGGYPLPGRAFFFTIEWEPSNE